MLLDRLLGATIHLLPRESYREQNVRRRGGARLRDEGRKPYFIPTGGSTTIGALGYVVATRELLAQARQLGIEPTHIVVATGSCGTHGGIVAGFALAGHGARIQGISVAGKADDRANVVRTRATDALDLIGGPTGAVAERVNVLDQYVGPGYGQPTEGMLEAVRLLAKLEGILLDPVYTGKAMAGLIDLVRRGEFKSHDTVIFWHTGGVPALFAYSEIF